MNTYVTGSTIRLLREAKGLTQAELARQLLVSAKTVSKWETAKDPEQEYIKSVRLFTGPVYSTQPGCNHQCR